jgi:hypothetical protein
MVVPNAYNESAPIRLSHVFNKKVKVKDITSTSNKKRKLEKNSTMHSETIPELVDHVQGRLLDSYNDDAFNNFFAKISRVNSTY